MCAQCRRIPKVRRTGDEERDKQATEDRQLLVRIIDIAVKFPNTRGKTHQYQLGLELKEDVAMNATTTKFEGPYTNIGKIPTPWKGQWLVKRGSSHGLTQEVMERAEANDQDFVCWLFRVALQMDDQTALPKDLIESTDASKLLTARSEEVGDRIQHLMREGGPTSDGRFTSTKALYLSW